MVEDDTSSILKIVTENYFPTVSALFSQAYLKDFLGGLGSLLPIFVDVPFSVHSMVFFFFLALFFYLRVLVLFVIVMNTVSDSVSVCLVERNISVPDYFSVPFQDVSDSKKIIYIYIYIISYPITFYTKKKKHKSYIFIHL